MAAFSSFSSISSVVCLARLPALTALSACLSLSVAHAGNSVWDLVDAMNQARQENGLHNLRADDRLLNSSGTHARDMAQRNYFSHYTPEGWDAAFRIFGWGYPRYAGVGENIAAGQGDAWAVVRAWLASPGHRANLLNHSFDAVGAGHYYRPGSPYVNYWVGHYGTD